MPTRHILSSWGYGFLQLSLMSVSALSIMTASALAQTVPSQADPGQFQRRFETRPDAQNVPKPIIETPALPQVNQADSNIKLTLQSVDIKGNTVYSADQLKTIYADKIGQQISLADLQKVANDITIKYRADGYILSQAVLTPQQINSGHVTIQIVEGFVENVMVEGEPSNRKLIEEYTTKIENSRPLNIKTLERYLLLANDLPGISARAVLRPSATTQGAADVVITVEEDKFEGSINIDNRGSDYVGPVQFTTVLTGNNLMKLYDRTTLRNVTTSDPTELKFFDLRHEEQIGTEGTKMIGIVSYSDSEPGSTLDAIDVEGKSFAFSLGGSHPFLRSRNENFTFRSSFDYRNTNTDILGLEINNDKVRALRIGADYDVSDSWSGVNLIEFEVSQGLDFWNATGPGIERSRADGEANFTKFNLDLSRLHTFNANWSFLASATGQYSLDPLLSSEEFTLGGASYGQAYDPSELAGDHGLAGRLELRYGNYVGQKYWESYQVYGFYDLGAVWQETSAVTPDSDKQSLASTGLGLRFNLTDTISGDTQVALPLTRDVETNGNQAPNVFFRLTKRF